ncbi:Piwi domain, partial [Dillenia turbinata]
GTSRPTHYQVLVDQIGFSADALQELVHNLSYVYQRSTTAISLVAPISYAHLAAKQVSQFLKFDDVSDSSSSNGSETNPSNGGMALQQLPRMNTYLKGSMFFC